MQPDRLSKEEIRITNSVSKQFVQSQIIIFQKDIFYFLILYIFFYLYTSGYLSL